MLRDRQRLNDILEALDWIARSAGGRTETDFLADETLCYAVAQKLTIVGEALARLSPELTARYNSVPWPDIVGLRNILVHEYFGIYWPLVWQTAVDHAPILRGQIAETMSAEYIVGLPAFAASFLRPLAQSRAAEFQNDLRLLVLRDGAHHLADQDAGRVVRHKVRFSHAHQFEAVFPKVRDDGFLYHEVARQTVQPFDDDHPHAVGM